MKTLASINFKGGVGKTTVSWLLAKYIAEKSKKKVLVVDIDPQMSLTLAVQMENDNGVLNKKFEQWNINHKDSQQSLASVLLAYADSKSEQINHKINTLIYKLSENLHLIPSSLDLYWLYFDVKDREKIKNFIKALLVKLEHNDSFNYDYIFFDCPPSFNALTYSVLNNSNTIIIPVNPDNMAIKSIYLLIEGLTKRIKSWESASLNVFMNKAKTFDNIYLTQESKTYLKELKKVKTDLEDIGIKINVMDCFIPDFVGMTNAITSHKFPSEYEEYFQNLWNNLSVEQIIKKK